LPRLRAGGGEATRPAGSCLLRYDVIHAAVNVTQLLLSAATYPGHSATGLAADWAATGDAACLLEPLIVG
jgi:hypothetical protein